MFNTYKFFYTLFLSKRIINFKDSIIFDSVDIPRKQVHSFRAKEDRYS